jgi:hypothetical protein
MIRPRPAARITLAAKLEFSSNDRSEDREAGHQIQATMSGDVIERLAYEGDELLCQKYAERLR